MRDTVPIRDHGGGLDAATARFGGLRRDWLDLSTGINPVPYPVGQLSGGAWTDLPDRAAADRLLSAARSFWNVPDGAGIVAAPGASALIARLPGLVEGCRAAIPGPTYNEHAAAFRAAGWEVVETGEAEVRVGVHPNNPDGRHFNARDIGGRRLTVIDESFCETCPDASHAGRTAESGVVVLKSFGKFWGLAGLRLGLMIGPPETCARMQEALGPWAVSGPALEIGARALEDPGWAGATRQRLARDAARLDAMMTAKGAELVGGTTLYRTYAVNDASAWQERLARARIWTRVFPYSRTWIRLGLPGRDEDWIRLRDALG
ncbi:pyridoxal phosphate-dependent class II aminotransferase [Roseibacterium sp. SDUM158017]|uniref:threonine-phosphate decarboxylase n=1 Tax=Roseicyclus salinarum TaxID=3036773 RepID=UPI002414EE71|nr:threonine-phosphate decarboxylase [Roseibacterium sp. SDUM158017]MDG4647062.1 pyridoxal phosphate-dependent class II aminotransferase [Roseibacterium sp. SDUM158017]